MQLLEYFLAKIGDAELDLLASGASFDVVLVFRNNLEYRLSLDFCEAFYYHFFDPFMLLFELLIRH